MPPGMPGMFPPPFHAGPGMPPPFAPPPFGMPFAPPFMQFGPSMAFPGAMIDESKFFYSEVIIIFIYI